MNVSKSSKILVEAQTRFGSLHDQCLHCFKSVDPDNSGQADARVVAALIGNLVRCDSQTAWDLLDSYGCSCDGYVDYVRFLQELLRPKEARHSHQSRICSQEGPDNTGFQETRTRSTEEHLIPEGLDSTSFQETQAGSAEEHLAQECPDNTGFQETQRRSTEEHQALTQYLKCIIEFESALIDPINGQKIDVSSQTVRVTLHRADVGMSSPVERRKLHPIIKNAFSDVLPQDVDLAESKGLTILGGAGTGKSTLAKQLCVACAQESLKVLSEDPDAEIVVPCKVPLVEIAGLLAKKVQRTELLKEFIAKGQASDWQEHMKHLQSWYKQGMIMPYLDGLDEASEHMNEVTRWIEEVLLNNQIFIIVSMRPNVYRPKTFKQRMIFEAVQMAPLTSKLAQNLAQQRLSSIQVGENEKQQVVEAVADREFEDLTSTPLLCTMLVHILLLRQARGADGVLHYVAEEVQWHFGNDIRSIITGISSSLKQSVQIYDEARRLIVDIYPKAFAMLTGIPSRSVADDEWDQLEHGICERSYDPEKVLEQVLADAQVTQQKVKAMIAPGTPWSQNRATADNILILQSDELGGESSWIVEVIDPGIKGTSDGGKRIRQKAQQIFPKLQSKGIARNIGDCYTRLFDLSRFTFVFNSCQEVLGALFQIEMLFGESNVICLTNKFRRPTPLGYSDVNLIVRILLDGCSRHHYCEIQLQVKAMIRAKHDAHKLYTEIREKLPNERIQQFMVDRLSGCVEATIQRMQVYQEALTLMLERWKVTESTEHLKVREVLADVAWSAHCKHQRAITESDFFDVAGMTEEATELWKRIAAGQIPIFELVRDSSPPAYRIFHLSFQTCLAGERLANKLQEIENWASELGVQLLSKVQETMLLEPWWAAVLVDAFECLQLRPGGPAAAKRLLRLIADKSLEDAERLCHIAVTENCQCLLEAVCKMKSDGLPINVNSPDPYGGTCLMKAARDGNAPMCSALLVCRADPELESRAPPSLKIVRGVCDVLQEDRCELTAGETDLHRFIAGLPSAHLPSTGTFMYEVYIHEAPKTLECQVVWGQRSSHTSVEIASDVTYEVAVRDTASLIWNEFSIGWMALQSSGYEKDMCCTHILGRNRFSLGLGCDGRCRFGETSDIDEFKAILKHRPPMLPSEGPYDISPKAEGQKTSLELRSFQTEGQKLSDIWQVRDVLGVAVSCGSHTKQYYFARNGSWSEVHVQTSLQDPVFPAITGISCSGSFTVNFGQEDFKHRPTTLGEVHPIAQVQASENPALIGARGGHLSVVTILLQQLTDVDHKDLQKHRSLLHWAAWWGWPSVVADLLSRGAALDAIDELQWTPIRAAFRGWLNAGETAKRAVFTEVGKMIIRVGCNWKDVAQTSNDRRAGELRYEHVWPHAAGRRFEDIVYDQNTVECLGLHLFLRAVVDGENAEVKNRLLKGTEESLASDAPPKALSLSFRLQSKDAMCLGELLSRCEQIQTIRCHGDSNDGFLSEQSLSDFSAGLGYGSLPNLIRLDLSNRAEGGKEPPKRICNLQPTDAMGLGTLISKLRQLKVINWSYNPQFFCSQSLCDLCCGLGDVGLLNLTALGLEQCLGEGGSSPWEVGQGLDATGAMHLGKLFAKCPKLERLDMKLNGGFFSLVKVQSLLDGLGDAELCALNLMKIAFSSINSGVIELLQKRFPQAKIDDKGY